MYINHHMLNDKEGKFYGYISLVTSYKPYHVKYQCLKYYVIPKLWCLTALHDCDNCILLMGKPVKLLIAGTDLMTCAISCACRTLSSTTACSTYWTMILNHCVYVSQPLEITMAR